MNTVQYVTLAAAFVAMIACAVSVFVWSRISASASRLRSMISLQGELLEVRDYLAKIDAWAKRINGREVQAVRRGDPTPTTEHGSLTGKDELRRRVGLIPGKVAPHS